MLVAARARARPTFAQPTMTTSNSRSHSSVLRLPVRPLGGGGARCNQSASLGVHVEGRGAAQRASAGDRDGDGGWGWGWGKPRRQRWATAASRRHLLADVTVATEAVVPPPPPPRAPDQVVHGSSRLALTLPTSPCLLPGSCLDHSPDEVVHDHVRVVPQAVGRQEYLAAALLVHAQHRHQVGVLATRRVGGGVTGCGRSGVAALRVWSWRRPGCWGGGVQGKEVAESRVGSGGARRG